MKTIKIYDFNKSTYLYINLQSIKVDSRFFVINKIYSHDLQPLFIQNCTCFQICFSITNLKTQVINISKNIISSFVTFLYSFTFQFNRRVTSVQLLIYRGLNFLDRLLGLHVTPVTRTIQQVYSYGEHKVKTTTRILLAIFSLRFK